MKAAIFIHGFLGGKFHYALIRNYLKKQKGFKLYEFDYKENYGAISLKVLSRRLADFIKSNVQEKNISLIGISQGGLIAEYYIQNYPNNVKKLITIDTPFKGVVWSKFFKGKGARDLDRKSEFIKDIEIKNQRVKGIKVYSLWTPFDLVVFPGKTAKNPVGKNKMSLSLSHHLTFWLPSTKKFVLNSLKE